jgi:hypothetical protein
MLPLSQRSRSRGVSKVDQRPRRSHRTQSGAGHPPPPPWHTSRSGRVRRNGCCALQEEHHCGFAVVTSGAARRMAPCRTPASLAGMPRDLSLSRLLNQETLKGGKPPLGGSFRRKRPWRLAGPPVTLGNMRANGVRSLPEADHIEASKFGQTAVEASWVPRHVRGHGRGSVPRPVGGPGWSRRSIRAPAPVGPSPLLRPSGPKIEGAYSLLSRAAVTSGVTLERTGARKRAGDKRDSQPVTAQRRTASTPSTCS